ncbi:MAG: hypothetical protein IJQ65_05325 [Kiritimatiellae bacterium]|nr:hypothetical protein [Kiritimatiellia bacterium]
MRILTIIAAMTAAAAFADCRTLGSNDYSYYRWNGQEGGTLRVGGGGAMIMLR